MKRETKVISLELAKQIDVEHKRIGIVVEGELWWNGYPSGVGMITDDKKEWFQLGGFNVSQATIHYPAYDVAEFGEMLSEVETDQDWYSEECCGIWYCRLHTHNAVNSCTRRVEGDTEAEARSKMYLWLLQNGYIKEGGTEHGN